jgi:hypothetical protein
VKPIGALFLVALAAVALAACGGTTSTTPYMWGGTVTITAGTASTTCVTTVTVVYSAAGVSPANVSVPVGGCVDFQNHDTVAHWPESNPHPTHTDCPWLNMAAPIPAGGSTTVGPAPAPPMVCGFHDHLNPPVA